MTMAQPQSVIGRDVIERQLVQNRARLSELDAQIEQLEAAREAVETQVIAAQGALEGWTHGYTYAKAEQLAAAEQKAAEKSEA